MTVSCITSIPSKYYVIAWLGDTRPCCCTWLQWVCALHIPAESWMESGRPCCDQQWQGLFLHEGVLPPKPCLPTESDTERRRTCPFLYVLRTQEIRVTKRYQKHTGFESSGQVQSDSTTVYKLYVVLGQVCHICGPCLVSKCVPYYIITFFPLTLTPTC